MSNNASHKSVLTRVVVAAAAKCKLGDCLWEIAHFATSSAVRTTTARIVVWRCVFVGTKISDLRQYPVLAEGGWLIVIKNQKTLQSISRTPWRLLGPINLLSDSLDVG